MASEPGGVGGPPPGKPVGGGPGGTIWPSPIRAITTVLPQSSVLPGEARYGGEDARDEQDPGGGVAGGGGPAAGSAAIGGGDPAEFHDGPRASAVPALGDDVLAEERLGLEQAEQ